MTETMTINAINPTTNERSAHTFSVEDYITTRSGAITIPLLGIKVVDTFTNK